MIDFKALLSASKSLAFCLPDGFLGRPYDSQYKYPSMEMTAERLVLETTQRVTLTIYGSPNIDLAPESDQIFHRVSVTGYDRSVVFDGTSSHEYFGGVISIGIF